nr:suppressor of fused domain protein [Deltaproteobacteria bacterium]
EQRKAEAEAKAKQDAARAGVVAAELERTAESQWSELAWTWLDDGVAHRALLQKLDGGAAAAEIAALDELSELGDDERASALPRVARELSGALEAILVGSLVRDDRLEGVLTKPSSTPEPDGEDDDDESSPGWDAIDAALEPIYGDAEPQHWGVVLPYGLGGNDPIHGISAYPRTDPVPHWHFITYGFTDLFRKENEDPAESGFGFELTFRLARDVDDAHPPNWALNFLQNLGRYVFGTGNRFAAGHKMGLNGPIALDHDTAITAICFAEDPELGEIVSEYGRAQFVQIVGITDDEYRLIQEWSTHGLIDILKKALPHLVTDLSRTSVLNDPVIAAEAEQRVAAEGSSEDLTFAGELSFQVDDGRVRLELGALYAAVLPRAMRGRIRHGREYTLRGRNASLHLKPASQTGYEVGDGELTLEITQELAREIEAQLGESLAGSYDFETWPALEIVVSPSFIRAQDGTAAEVKGLADPARAEELLAAENARLAALEDEDEDEDAEDEDDDDVHSPDPERVTAALAMTTRALALAPDDSDVQFTHAMLLFDADRMDELVAAIPAFVPSVRVNVAVRVGKRGHARFGQIVDLALADALPARIMSSSSTPVGGAAMLSFGDVANELFGELAESIIEHVPERLGALVPLLPDDVNLLSELAFKSIEAKLRDAAMALYGKILELPIPDQSDQRLNYLRALNNACVQAHAAKAYDAAAKIADRAQPVAHENPYIYHSAACAYAALGDYAKALDQVRLAIEHEYEHVSKVEVDHDLGPLLESPEFKAMFRDWHARQEGN